VVEDNGKGIIDEKWETVDRIIEFKRRKSRRGWGVGLHLIQHLLQARCNWRIWAETLKNPDGSVRGTQVILEYPFREKIK